MSEVFHHSGDDPEMKKAFATARQTFRIFWRELNWENHRIVPGLDLACVKFPLTDPQSSRSPKNKDVPDAEQMWVSDCTFDGKTIKGTLLNSPNWLTSVKEGDSIEKPINELSDWMYAVHGKVYGAFTVHLLRRGMQKAERKAHDDAWGLDFGDPDAPRLAPADWYGSDAGKKSSFLGKLFAKPPENLPLEEIVGVDHPMAIAMASKLEEQLDENPEAIQSADEDGMSILHKHCLAGSTPIVEILLKRGADPNAVTNNGMTPLRMAKFFGWSRVVGLLTAAGARA